MRHGMGLGPYEFTQQIGVDGHPWGLRTCYTFDDQGRVFKRGRKSPCGVWYALLGENNSGQQYVIRRDKLNDIALIENFRWRVFLRHRKTWERYREAYEGWKSLGRIWNAGTERFHVYDQGSFSVREPPEGAVDRLAMIPLPEEIEAGRAYFDTAAALEESFGQRAFADLILRRAFSIANPEPVSYNVQPRTTARVVRHVVNRREYVHYTPSGWAQKTITLWPEPGDDIEQHVYEPLGFRCLGCDVRFKSSGETHCDVCLPRRRRRGTPVRARTRGAAQS